MALTHTWAALFALALHPSSSGRTHFDHGPADGNDRAGSFLYPALLLAAAIATLVARSIEPRSIYDARQTDEELAMRQLQRDALAAPTVRSGKE
jgi:hypothetical protein